MIILRQKSKSLPAFSGSIDSTSLLLVHMMQKVSCDWTDDIQNITYKYWSILKLKSIILCETDHWTDQSLGYCLIEADIKWLTHKQLGTNWCKISPAATDGLVLWQCWLSVYCFTQESLKGYHIYCKQHEKLKVHFVKKKNDPFVYVLMAVIHLPLGHLDLSVLKYGVSADNSVYNIKLLKILEYGSHSLIKSVSYGVYIVSWNSGLWWWWWWWWWW